METITILPKDVSVAWMPEQNAFEIKINKETMIEKETGNLLVEKIYDELGDYDIVECNEINSSTDNWLIADSKIYIFNGKNVAELKETGVTIIGYHGTIKENVELTLNAHTDFIMWYYHADTIEEAVQLMNETNE